MKKVSRYKMEYYNNISQLQIEHELIAEELLLAHDAEGALWKDNGLRLFPNVEEYAEFEMDKETPPFEDLIDRTVNLTELGNVLADKLSTADVYKTTDGRVVVSDYVWNDGPNR